ncbi:MAG: hypothetical protein WBG42_12955, partial [Cryomorphaceae bacterium]
AQGLELMELTEELERLLIFESFLRFAISKEHKLISAVYKYRDYLIEKRVEMSEVESKYCANRMKKQGVNYKKGFWYNVRKDVRSAIDSAILN